MWLGLYALAIEMGGFIYKVILCNNIIF